MTEGLLQANLSRLPLLSRGKVRDIYAVGDEHLLVVATDRISAFDVILAQPIPGKGEVLTRLTRFWTELLGDDIPTQTCDLEVADVITDPRERTRLGDRAMVVRRLRPLPVEAVVRGYLVGSGWKDYQRDGAVSGITLAPGLAHAASLPEPIFTPSTKAELGAHDASISYAAVVDTIGAEISARVRALSLALYERGRRHALERGIIIADTKFEFGLDENDEVHLIDEVLTPDSFRFWPASEYQAGTNPPSFDKQFVRDYLETLSWDKRPPPPPLPPEIIARTAIKYREAERQLTQ